jgi:hypothetical protein
MILVLNAAARCVENIPIFTASLYLDQDGFVTKTISGNRFLFG